MVESRQTADLAQRESNRGGPQVCNPPTYCRSCLTASTLATELTANQSDALFNIVEVRKLPKNEILISEGDDDDHLYALAKGEFEISRAGARGQEVIGRLGPGSIVGELAFLDGLKRTATVKAVNDECCVMVLHRQQLETLLSEDPWLVYKVMRSIVRSAHRTVDKMDTTFSDLMHYISG